MVRLEEIQDEAIKRQQKAAFVDGDDEDDWENESDASSDISDSDDESDASFDVSERGLSVRRESLLERLSALKDIVPPSTRRSLSSKASSLYGYASITGKLVGNLAWVVTTSALLVGLPYALAVEDEGRMVQQEREFMQQQSGAQMLGGAPPAAGAQPGQQQQGQPGQQQQGIRPPGF